MNGTIDGTEVLLVNVYAPNEDDADFIKKILSLFLDKSEGLLLIGGDWNCVMSQSEDKLPAATNPCTRMSKALRGHCIELGQIDVWRHLYPSGRNYTFYSNRHLSYCRVDTSPVMLWD